MPRVLCSDLPSELLEGQWKILHIRFFSGGKIKTHKYSLMRGFPTWKRSVIRLDWLQKCKTFLKQITTSELELCRTFRGFFVLTSLPFLWIWGSPNKSSSGSHSLFAFSFLVLVKSWIPEWLSLEGTTGAPGITSTLGSTTSDWPPAEFHAADHNAENLCLLHVLC